jgi:tetratricopeptide (TPR) repeat protein
MSSNFENNFEKICKRMCHVGFYLADFSEFKDLEEIEYFYEGIDLMADEQYLEAIQSLQKCLKLRLNRNKKSTIWLLIGACHYVKEYWNYAYHSWKAALVNAEKANNLQAQATIIGNLGLTFVVPYEQDMAIKCFVRSIRIKQKIGDDHGVAQTCINLARRYWAEQSKAVKFFRIALRKLKKIRDEATMSDVYANLGKMHDMLEETDKTIACYKEAIRLKEKIGDISGLVRICKDMGWIHQGNKDYNTAIDCYQMALEAMEKSEGNIENKLHIPSIKMLIASVYHVMGNEQEAKRIWEEKDVNSYLMTGHSYRKNMEKY